MNIKTGGLWELTDQAQVVTFIGAGGKTTSLLRLAEELGQLGKRYVLSTTTKVFPFSLMAWESLVCPPPLDQVCGGFWYGYSETATGKWAGPSMEALDRAIKTSKDIIWGIEGDGARSHLLKCWAEHEPQIPTATCWVVLLLDASLWGNPLGDRDVHRPEHCDDLIGRTWDADTCWKYLQQSPMADARYSGFAWAVLFNERTSRPSEELVEILQEMAAGWNFSRPRLPNVRLAVGSVKEGHLKWLDLS